MEREDIIYNDYLKIKKVYDKLTSKQSEILNREIECSEKIKLLKQEISFKMLLPPLCRQSTKGRVKST